MLREKSDYEDFYEADEEETADIIFKVETFIKDVEAYLQNQGVLK